MLTTEFEELYFPITDKVSYTVRCQSSMQFYCFIEFASQYDRVLLNLPLTRVDNNEKKLEYRI